MTERADGQVTWSDLGLWSGKMCPEHSAATKGETLRQSSKRSSASQSRKPPILKCLKKDGQLGGATTTRWEDDGAWLGECMMRNTGESPNAAAVSRLSQILEVTPQEKYSLSAKACQGILRRAERRGKDLPETLKTVLLMQSGSGGGCDGGGKGALVQTEKSGTLGTGNDQTIFCMETQRDCVIPSQALTEVASTLRAGAGAPKHDADIRGRLAISYKRTMRAGFEATPINLMVATRCKALGRGTGFGVGEPGDPANTISAAHSHGVFATAIPINDKATRWQGGGESRNHDGSGNGLGIGKEGDPSPTLTAGDRHGVMCLNDQGGNVMGVSHDVSGTLRAQEHGHQPSILDMSHACDVIRDCGEIVPSLQARMGTGGNQILLTYQETTGTLSPGAHPGSYNGQDAYNDMLVCGAAAPDIAHALKAKANCDFREDSETYPVQNMVVRRLTPMECERLQGFPDHWTDIGEWRDSKGKLRKPSDSPRYKALGNSIALPFWDFLAKRISAQYLRPVTMGSLFDGIGGFPLVFERHNGKGSAHWASEIEEFPIAVTKLRFGED